LGHHLAAVVQVGSSGVSAGVISATEQALATHELIKVKIAEEREGRPAAIAALVEATGAELAQTIGRTVLLFKKKKKKSKFENLFKPGGEVEVETTRKKGAKAATKKAPGAKKLLRNAAEDADDGEATEKPVDWYEEEVEEVDEE
jgi:RNA-binding protein